MPVQSEEFGKVRGIPVKRFTISTEDMEVRVLELGATLQGLRVKDKTGKPVETVLFHDSLEKYLTSPGYWGAVCGRHANRIAKAQADIGGTIYQMDKNENANNLHSGKDGFHHKIFSGTALSDTSVVFTYLSSDGEQGFPGNMFVKVTYSITPENSLLIEYTTTSDADTVWNLTNHAYFNLGGEGTVLNHTLQVAADFYTPVDEEKLTTGEILSVCETPFDLREPQKLASRIGDGKKALAEGYDHNFVLRQSEDVPDATLFCPENGVSLDVYTTLPGLQIYSGGSLSGSDTSNGRPVPPFGGICMETQYFPNSLAYAHFPQPIQCEGTLVEEWTEFYFSIK